MNFTISNIVSAAWS